MKTINEILRANAHNRGGLAEFARRCAQRANEYTAASNSYNKHIDLELIERVAYAKVAYAESDAFASFYANSIATHAAAKSAWDEKDKDAVSTERSKQIVDLKEIFGEDVCLPGAGAEKNDEAARPPKPKGPEPGFTA